MPGGRRDAGTAQCLVVRIQQPPRDWDRREGVGHRILKTCSRRFYEMNAALAASARLPRMNRLQAASAAHSSSETCP